jgi:hypothetical protein
LTSAANRVGKKQKFLSDDDADGKYYLLVCCKEDAKCEPSQGCHNPCQNDDTVHNKNTTNPPLTFLETGTKS